MGGPIEQERGRVFIGVGDTGVGCLEARPGSKRESKAGLEKVGKQRRHPVIDLLWVTSEESCGVAVV